MRVYGQLIIGLIVLCVLGGCRTVARVKEVPRVDLQVDGAGNRGYFIGAAPAAPPIKTTRQMIDVEIELPSSFHPEPRTLEPVSMGDLAPPEIELESTEIPAAWTEPAKYETYVVQKGDTLWTIAAQDQVYGKATRWRRIFDANRDLLANPSALKEGMRLRIPHGADDAFQESGVVSGK